MPGKDYLGTPSNQFKWPKIGNCVRQAWARGTMQRALTALVVLIALWASISIFAPQFNQRGPRQRFSTPQTKPLGCLLTADGPVGGCTTRDLTVAFAMIGRDVAHELPYVLRNIERMMALFKRSHVILVENDSMDTTVNVFNAWANSMSNSTTTLGEARVLSMTHSTRGKKDFKALADARNVYLELLMRPEFQYVDFMIPMDTDMCFAQDVDTFANVVDSLLPAFGRNWTILYPNGVCGWWIDQSVGETNLVYMPFGVEGMLLGNPACVPTYCDLFALRDYAGTHHTSFHINFIPGRCDIRDARKYGCSYLNGEAVVPVQSAFGGMAMYWMGLFKTGDTISKVCRHQSTDEEPCDHVDFNYCLQNKRGAKQLLATRWIVDWEGCMGPVQDTPQQVKCILPVQEVYGPED